MSTANYQPYTYLIGWTKLNKYYYGARWAKGCHVNDLWVKYKTSSNVVKRIHKEYGEPDVIQVRKIFKTKEETILWEQNVLIRLHRKLPFQDKKSKWLNINPYASPPDSTGRRTKGNYGRKFSNEHKRKISEALKGRSHNSETKEKWSKTRKGRPAHNKGKSFSEEAKKNMSIAQKNRSPITEETRSHLSKIRKGEGNPNFGKHASDETKRKIGEKSKGTSWYNDGVKNHKIKPEVAFALGYIKGRIKKD